MRLKQGDKVVVIAGKDKGKEGKIIKTLRADNKVIVEGVNIVKKHIKPNGGESEEFKRWKHLLMLQMLWL